VVLLLAAEERCNEETAEREEQDYSEGGYLENRASAGGVPN
jgi:hypothetical protein